MASWAEILVHTKANEDSWFVRPTPSVIASTAFPGRTARVYPCKMQTQTFLQSWAKLQTFNIL